MVFPAFIWAALRLGPQGATLAVAVAAVIAVVATSHQQGPFVEHSPTDSALNLQLYITFAALTTCCLAAIVSERRRAGLELAESQRREGERAALERQRIARDLHDSVSQSLFSTTLHVRTAQHTLAREGLDSAGPVGEELSEIGQLTRGALAEMRALIFELRPGALAEEGLVAALTKQASALSAREGLAIEVDGPDERLPLEPEVEEQLYRLGQEALANVVKHARASNATVRIAVQRRHRLGRGVRRRPWLRPGRRGARTLRPAIDARPSRRPRGPARGHKQARSRHRPTRRDPGPAMTLPSRRP